MHTTYYKVGLFVLVWDYLCDIIIITLQKAVANVSDTSSSLLSSFVNEHAIKLWRDCCKAATECCESMVRERNSQLITKDKDSSNAAMSKGPSSLCKSHEGT